MTRKEHKLWCEALDAAVMEPTGRCPASKTRFCGCELLEWSSDLDSMFYQFYYKLNTRK